MDATRRTVNNILLDGPNLRAYRHFPNVGKRKSWAAADASKRGIELAIISRVFRQYTFTSVIYLNSLYTKLVQVVL